MKMKKLIFIKFDYAQPRDIKPKWGSAEFPKESTTDKLKLLVSGNDDAPLQIHQDARIYTGTFKDQTTSIIN